MKMGKDVNGNTMNGINIIIIFSELSSMIMYVEKKGQIHMVDECFKSNIESY